MTYIEQQARILKIATIYKNKKETKMDDNQSFTNTYFVLFIMVKNLRSRV